MLYAHPGREYDQRNTYDVEEASENIAAQLRTGREAHGITTVVDMTTAELGRNPFLIKRSAEKSGVNLVATTGFFPDRIGIPFHWRRQTVEYIAEYYRRDIVDGMAYASSPTTIKAGMIKVSTGSMGADDGASLVGPSGRRITEVGDRCARAAGRTQALLGCLINTHTEPNDYSVTNPGIELLDVLEEEGADAAKVCHQPAHGPADRDLRAWCVAAARPHRHPVAARQRRGVRRADGQDRG
jgi:phosphotriesterase-related protein